MKFSRGTALAVLAVTTALGASLTSLPLGNSGQAFAAEPTNTARPDRPPRPSMADLTEAHLAYLKTALKITDAQSKQWDAYANVVRKEAKEREAAMKDMRANRERGTHPSLLDRVERQQKMATAMAASAGERLAALRPLYASLSTEQKQTADFVLGRGGPRGMMHRGPGGPGGPGGAPAPNAPPPPAR